MEEVSSCLLFFMLIFQMDLLRYSHAQNIQGQSDSCSWNVC